MRSFSGQESQGREFSFCPLGHHHLELRVVVVQVRADAGGQEPGAGAVKRPLDRNHGAVQGALHADAQGAQFTRTQRPRRGAIRMPNQFGVLMQIVAQGERCPGGGRRASRSAHGRLAWAGRAPREPHSPAVP